MIDKATFFQRHVHRGPCVSSSSTGKLFLHFTHLHRLCVIPAKLSTLRFFSSRCYSRAASSSSRTWVCCSTRFARPAFFLLTHVLFFSASSALRWTWKTHKCVGISSALAISPHFRRALRLPHASRFLSCSLRLHAHSAAFGESSSPCITRKQYLSIYTANVKSAFSRLRLSSVLCLYEFNISLMSFLKNNPPIQYIMLISERIRAHTMSLGAM